MTLTLAAEAIAAGAVVVCIARLILARWRRAHRVQPADWLAIHIIEATNKGKRS